MSQPAQRLGASTWILLTSDLNTYIKSSKQKDMTEEIIPQYKELHPKPALDAMIKLAEEIKSGAFKVVGFTERTQNEILTLPNPGGKPFTKPTGRQIKTIEIKVSNQVIE